MATLSKSERPQITLPLQSLDYLLEILAGLGLLALLGLTIFHFGQLPEQVPTHFGADGRPNAFGAKTILWLLPVLGTVLYVFMSLINRRPDRFNYTVKITPENAEVQYQMATRLIRAMKALILLLFSFLLWRTIQIANNEATELGAWFLPALLIATLGSLFLYISRSVAHK